MFSMVISIVLVLISSLLFLSLFRPVSKVAAILGLYIIGFSLVVVVEEIAHFFNGLGQPGLILIIQGAFLGLAAGLWAAKKRPVIGSVLVKVSLARPTGSLMDAWKGHPENMLLTAAVGLGYAYSFFLGWMIAPNTYDAITTHVVRVVFWLQHGNLTPWNAIRYTQVSYPLNSQLQMLWSGQFLHSDQLFFTVQWLGALISILCVFGIARLLRFSRAQSLFASLAFACFPLIWMQSSTAQNDLVAAAVFLPAFYFFFLGITRPQRSMLTLSGIALGLSLGTKQTLYFYLPGLALLAGLVWLKYRTSMTKSLLYWAAACLAGFLVLGSFTYVQNYVYFDHPLAPPEALDSAVGGTAPDKALGNITYNSLRLLYQSVDNSGLPEPAGDFLTRAKNKSIGAVLRLLNPNLETGEFTAATHQFNYRKPNVLGEDSSWFGPIAGILFIPMALYQLVQAFYKKDPWRGGFVGIVILYWLLDAWLRPGWDPYPGRYFIPAAGLLAAFLAGLVSPGWFSRVASILIAAFSIFILATTAIYNPGKSPIVKIEGIRSVNENISMMFKLDWISQVTLQLKGAADLARLVDENVPTDSVLGWYAGTAPEYPVFGEHFTHEIIPIHPAELINDREWLTQQNIEFILMDVELLKGPFPPDYKEKESTFNWLLLVHK